MMRGSIGWRPFLAPAVVAGLWLAACGGSGSGATPTVGESFAAHALAVCEAALQDKQGWQAFPVPDFDPSKPDLSAFPEVATWLQGEVAPTFESWSADLKALGAPPFGQGAWNDTVAAVDRIVQLNAQQIAAAKTGDAQGFAAATRELRDVQTQLVSATEAAGVGACAEVHAS